MSVELYDANGNPFNLNILNEQIPLKYMAIDNDILLYQCERIIVDELEDDFYTNFRYVMSLPCFNFSEKKGNEKFLTEYNKSARQIFCVAAFRVVCMLLCEKRRSEKLCDTFLNKINILINILMGNGCFDNEFSTTILNNIIEIINKK